MPRFSQHQPPMPQLQQQAGHVAASYRPVGIRAVAAGLASRPRGQKAPSIKDIPAILRAEAQFD